MDIINLGIGSPDLSPSPEAVEILTAEARRPDAHGYQSYIGIPELRSAISSYMEEYYGVFFNPSNEILPLMGSKEGIMQVTMAFADPGDKVLIPDPGYPTYQSVAGLAEAEPLHYHLDESDHWKIDFDYLEKLPLNLVKIMWINYPHMPTGARGDLDDFRRLIDLAKEYGFLVINDNPYGQLYEGKLLSIFQVEGSRDVALELNSMSKSHNMAGWRVGWLLGDEAYIKDVLRVKSNMDSGMFYPVQRAASYMLKSEIGWYEYLRKMYGRRRKIGLQIFDALGCTYAGDLGGMFIWGKAPDHIRDVPEWTDSILMSSGVFITPGIVFGKTGNRYLRLSLCSSEDILKQALERILKLNY